MKYLSEAAVCEIRELFCKGFTIAQIARAIEDYIAAVVQEHTDQHRSQFTREVREVFQQAFSLKAHERVSVFRFWQSDGDCEISDIRLNELLAPFIIRVQERWVHTMGEVAQWVREINVDMWERVISERPSSVPEELWSTLDKEGKDDLRLRHNNNIELQFRCECLGAQLQQLSRSSEKAQLSKG